MTAAAYYNEFDPYAAQWLRNLIAAGHLPDGDVDTRSIVDVHPADTLGFDQCHFFAGIGGWPLALRLAGWPDERPVWTGSCPCQPFSAAGKRKGTADARHLWPEFNRLIGQWRPAVVFGEQVASKDGRAWLAGIRADLEALGYAVGAADLCAASAGAPHIRQRLFWVADASFKSRERDAGSLLGAQAQVDSEDRAQHGGGAVGPEYGSAGMVRQSGRLADAMQPGRAERRAGTGRGPVAGSGATGRLADADGGLAGHGRLQPGGQHGQQPQDGGACGVADMRGAGLEGRDQGEVGHECAPAQRSGGAGDSGVGDASGQGSGRHPGTILGAQGEGESQRCELGRVADELVDAGDLGFWSSFDLIPCTDGKARRVEPGTFPLAHGVPGRVGRLRAYGNAIVPALAAEFIEAWQECRP